MLRPHEAPLPQPPPRRCFFLFVFVFFLFCFFCFFFLLLFFFLLFCLFFCFFFLVFVFCFCWFCLFFFFFFFFFFSLEERAYGTACVRVVRTTIFPVPFWTACELEKLPIGTSQARTSPCLFILPLFVFLIAGPYPPCLCFLRWRC